MGEGPVTNGKMLPADTAAGPSAAEGDELAKGLPGLPIELRNCYVAEQGFYPKTRGDPAEAHVPWHEVTGFRPMGFGSTAIEAQSPDACEVRPVPLSATKEQIRILRAAWREYVLRRIERDGVLKGTYYLPRPELRHTGALVVSLLSVACGFVWLRAGWILSRPGWSDPEARLAAWFLGGLGLLAGVLMFLESARLKRTTYEARLHWYRWELRKTGLVHWPYDQETVLVPSAGDALAPNQARVGGSIVPFTCLTCRDVLIPLLLAIGERSGSHIRRDFGSQWPALIFPGLGVCAVASIAAALLRMGGQAAITVFAMLAALIAAGVVVFIASARSRSRQRDLVALGRAMLERLGW